MDTLLLWGQARCVTAQDKEKAKRKPLSEAKYVTGEGRKLTEGEGISSRRFTEKRCGTMWNSNSVLEAGSGPALALHE